MSGHFIQPQKPPAVVGAHSNPAVRRFISADPSALRHRNSDHIGQVIFALRIVRPQPVQRVQQKIHRKPVSPGVDLPDLQRFFIRVRLFDNAGHISALAPDNPPVAGGVRKRRREQRDGRSLFFM